MVWFALVCISAIAPPFCAARPVGVATAPNVSLATVPVAYFGGHHSNCKGETGCRSKPNLRMLAKMRLMMIEKWEGHCYDECMYNASKQMECNPSCNVEGDMLDTLSRAKQLNPALSSVFYLNSLMAFPFYALSGKFAAAKALLIDMYTNKPVELVNDEGMKKVWVYDWGNPVGRKLFLAFVSDIIASGLVDGMFFDKWGTSCQEVNSTTWKICNNRCGYVTPAVAKA
eukprot:TRINITY_DN66800_c0_g1_i1.p2 TRINITY_DN66800_c0_g1~~TRINITY_DN66800_c0_g1_i1.p2  ORF type:complete len:261 (-),score=33.93 TRINITY_DN66800_c0_g1_i1:701-1384(-)